LSRMFQLFGKLASHVFSIPPIPQSALFSKCYT
jgi:hypothetical protein